MIYSLVSLVVLAVSALGSDVISEHGGMSLVKRDPSAVRATRAFQNCLVRDKHYHAKHPGGQMFCNERIQMAECYVNAR